MHDRTAAPPARRRVRLADLGRALVLGASLACAVVLAVLWWRPDWADAAGDWLRHRVEARHLRHWQEVSRLAGSDPAAELGELAAWSRELAGTRKLDALAPVVRFVERRAVALAERLGDRETALAHARRWADLDPRDVDALGTLGRLLGADRATRREGIALLDKAFSRVPDSPALVPPLCELLAEDGDLARAARVLLGAAGSPPSNLWHVQWSDDPRHQSFFLPRRRGQDGIEARFTIEAPVAGLRFRLPAFRAIELHDVRLSVETPGAAPADVPFEPELTAMRAEDGALTAFGAPDPAFVVPSARSAGPCTFELRARAIDTVPDWLRELVLGPVGARLVAAPRLDAATARELRALRARAFHGARAKLCSAPASSPFDAGSTVRLRGHPEPDGFAFTLEWPLPAAAAVIRIELPRGVLARYRMRELSCDPGEGGARIDLDLAALQSTSAVELDGDIVRTTGAAPSITWALPAGVGDGARVRLAGVAR